MSIDRGKRRKLNRPPSAKAVLPVKEKISASNIISCGIAATAFAAAIAIYWNCKNDTKPESTVPSSELTVTPIPSTAPQNFEQQANIPAWLNIDPSVAIKLGKNNATQAVHAALDWDNKFHCGRSVLIRHDDEIHRTTLPNGKVQTTLEKTSPGIISLRMQTNRQFNAYNITLHAMTHACKPDAPTYLARPIPISGGKITGFHGLTLSIELNDGEKVYYSMFEESIAERNGRAVSREYSTLSPSYAAIGSLAIQKFPLKSLEAGQFAKSNNVEGFTRGFFGYNTDHKPTDFDYDLLIKTYNNEWDKGGGVVQ